MSRCDLCGQGCMVTALCADALQGRLPAETIKTMLRETGKMMECGAQRFWLGFMHHQGVFDTPIDETRAFELYEQSAALDYPRGVYAVGICYWTGIGTVQDKHVGRCWLQKAADMGLPHAAYILMCDALTPEYAEKYPDKIMELMDIAANGGILEAQALRRALYSEDAQAAVRVFTRH